MACNGSDLIEYTGISTRLPSNPTTFTQVIVSNELCIPTVKPDIERIVRVDTQITIKNKKVINTPKATSLEGQILTGFKYIITGTINQTVMYVSATTDQSVHSAHFETPFCEYIVLPVGFTLATPISVIPYIEEVRICQIDSRCFSSCNTILLNVVFCGTPCPRTSNNGCSNIKIINIANTLPQNPLYFKELTIQENLTIPDVKPNMEDIMSVGVEVEITSLRIVSTRTGTSLEGQNLSGCKLIVEMKLNEIVVYVADKITQPVHSAHFDGEMRSAFIILPCTINGRDIYDLLATNSIKVTPYIESVCATMIDNRNIFKCVTLLLDATIL